MQENNLFKLFLSEIQYCVIAKDTAKCIKSVIRKWIKEYHPDRNKHANVDSFIKYLVSLLPLKRNELHDIVITVTEEKAKFVARAIQPVQAVNLHKNGMEIVVLFPPFRIRLKVKRFFGKIRTIIVRNNNCQCIYHGQDTIYLGRSILCVIDRGGKCIGMENNRKQ